jgi:hypothetical protein
MSCNIYIFVHVILMTRRDGYYQTVFKAVQSRWQWKWPLAVRSGPLPDRQDKATNQLSILARSLSRHCNAMLICPACLNSDSARHCFSCSMVTLIYATFVAQLNVDVWKEWVSTISNMPAVFLIHVATDWYDMLHAVVALGEVWPSSCCDDKRKQVSLSAWWSYREVYKR